MKKAVCISLALSLCLNGFCQSYITRNESLIQPLLINPATCGADYIPKATLSYQKQWLSIPQAPSSFYFAGEIRLGKFDFYNPRMYINDTKFKSLERVGLGAGLYSDNNGPFREVNLLLTYSYHVPLNENTFLSFGITGKINHFGTDVSEVDPVSPDDPLINFEDHTDVNASVGSTIYHNEFYAGISGVNLFNTATVPMNFVALKQVFCGIGGYRFRNDRGSIILEPSMAFKYFLNDQTNLIDFYLKLYVVKYGWLSVSYLNETQLQCILALRVYKSYYIAYKYADIENDLASYTNSTHGIMVGVNLGVNRNTAAIY